MISEAAGQRHPRRGGEDDRGDDSGIGERINFRRAKRRKFPRKDANKKEKNVKKIEIRNSGICHDAFLHDKRRRHLPRQTAMGQQSSTKVIPHKKIKGTAPPTINSRRAGVVLI